MTTELLRCAPFFFIYDENFLSQWKWSFWPHLHSKCWKSKLKALEIVDKSFTAIEIKFELSFYYNCLHHVINTYCIQISYWETDIVPLRKTQSSDWVSRHYLELCFLTVYNQAICSYIHSKMMIYLKSMNDLQGKLCK